MDHEVRSGVLHVQRGSGLVKKFQKRYVALYRRSQHGVSRLEIFENKDGYDKRTKNPKKNIISLEACATISRKSLPDGKKFDYQIVLTFDGSKEQLFQADSAEEMELWYASMSNVIFGGGGLTDNMIYAQYEQDGYDVVIKVNDVAQKLKLSGLYNLNVSAEDIELRDKETKKEIFKWPLDRLRKYGRDKMEFSLEAGRRCPTGPGMFYFITDHYNEIFQDVDQKVKNLAKTRDRTTSVSSTKDGKSPTFASAPTPDSPLLLSPSPHSSFPKVESEYDNPLDTLRSPPPLSQEPIYNDPVDVGRPSVKPARKKDKKGSPKKTKPEPVKKSGGILGGKKDKKKKVPPKNLPPSPAPPPGLIEEATYSSAMPIAAAVPTADGEYGRLDFEGGKRISGASAGEDNQYDSLNVWNNSTGGSLADESEYATAESISPRFSNLSAGSGGDDVYDHVKRS